MQEPSAVTQRGSRRPGHRRRFLDEQLKLHLLREAFRAAGVPLTLRSQSGYDHSYDVTAGFMADHIAHHARILKA